MSVSRLSDPDAVQKAVREFDRIGRTAFLEKYSFGRAREYMLREPDSGRLYDSKAIVGAAFGYQFPDEGPLSATLFSGGEDTVERKLTELGFDVVRVGQDWSREEVELTVADYFEMLALEAGGAGYRKAQHNEALRNKLRVRSKASIELKHQNISAVLDEIGLPYIPGYKPRYNFQELLRECVRRHVETHLQALVTVIDDFESVTPPVGRRYQGVLVTPPRIEMRGAPKPRPRLPRKLDYVARDERNRELGRAGEEWVLGYEAVRLAECGRKDLVPFVDWVSDRLGDGAGFDIKSFEVGGDARFIEVKTTNGGPQTSFVVSANELDFSKEAGDSFYLYRVFDYSTGPRLFILQGDLRKTLSLEPIDYRARLKSL